MLITLKEDIKKICWILYKKDYWRVTVLLIVSIFLIKSNFKVYLVKGDSMEPNLNNHEVFIVNFLAHKIFGIKRYDVLVLIDDEGDGVVKRVVGMPKERVKLTNGVIYIDGKRKDFPLAVYRDAMAMTTEEITLKEGEYFFIGDNRGNTSFGITREENIIGLLK